jgi:hypothetical protein
MRAIPKWHTVFGAGKADNQVSSTNKILHLNSGKQLLWYDPHMIPMVVTISLMERKLVQLSSTAREELLAG